MGTDPIVKHSPAGEFDRSLLQAITSEEHLFSNVTHTAVPELIRQVITVLDREFPDSGGDKAQSPIEELILRCRHLLERGHRSPECCHAILAGLSETGRALIEFLGERHDEIREFIFAETPEDQLKAEVVDLCAKSISLNPDKHDIELVTRLLETQENCIVSEIEKQDPSRPVRGGLLSPISLNEFLEALQAENAHILICKSADAPYGFVIYHGTGSCAEEDRAFVDRALDVLTSEEHQRQIEKDFGHRFNPESVATVYSALIDPDIRLQFERGGAETPRSLAYDSLVYYMLHELAVRENRPEWALAWVRTWPNPNEAIKAHERVLFHDTGIEMEFNPLDPNPDRLRLKLLLVHLGTHFDAEGNPRMDIDPSQRGNPVSYGNLSFLHRSRMLESIRGVPLVDLDIAP